MAVRVGFVATLDERLTWADEQSYVDIARLLAAGDGFVSSSYRGAPILPAYLALVFHFFGDAFLVARIGQAILGGLTCLLLMRIGSLLVGPTAGALAGVLLAVYPPHVYLAGVFYSSALETFFCAVAVWLAARVATGHGAAGVALACGAVLGLGILTRPAYVVLAPCIATVWLARGALGFRRAAAAGAALAIGVVVVVLPWSARNRAVYGRFVLVSSGGGTTLWKGNNELADGTADDRFLGWGRPVWMERRARLDPGERAALDAKYDALHARVVAREREVGDTYLAMDDVLGPVARTYVTEEPMAALGRAGRKLLTFFSAFSPTLTEGAPRWMPLVAAATFYPVLALALLAPALAPTRAAGLLLPYAVVAAVAASHALLTSCTRFRLPLDPYLILGAALALVALAARGRSSSGHVAGPRTSPARPRVS